MGHLAGEEHNGSLRFDDDRRLKLEFHGSKVTSDFGLRVACIPRTRRRARADRNGQTSAHRWEDRNEQPARPDRAIPADGVRAPRLIRGCQRRRSSRPRSGDALGYRRPGGDGVSRIHQPDGTVRDRGADRRGEPRHPGRSVGPMDRCRARPPAHRPVVLDMDGSVSETHGERDGTAYNGRFGRICYHPLFVIQPVRRSGTLRLAAGQRSRCRRMGRGAGTGGRAVS
jgi:hypothetical protein